MRSASPSYFTRVWRTVKRIPRGRVATYGQIAALAGMPRGARVVGYALRAAKGETLPWQRVIGRRRAGVGHISIRDPVGGALQRKLLEREGITVSAKGEVDLERFGWGAGSATARPARRRPPHRRS